MYIFPKIINIILHHLIDFLPIHQYIRIHHSIYNDLIRVFYLIYNSRYKMHYPAFYYTIITIIHVLSRAIYHSSIHLHKLPHSIYYIKYIMNIFSKSIGCIIFPITFINVSIYMVKFPKSICLIIFKVSFIFRSILKFLD